MKPIVMSCTWTETLIREEMSSTMFIVGRRRFQRDWRTKITFSFFPRPFKLMYLKGGDLLYNIKTYEINNAP